MFTANTMSSAIEALGMSLPGTSSTVASVSRHDIAAIWVAFFSRCRRYRCRQGWEELNQPRGEFGANPLTKEKKAEVQTTVDACFNLLRKGIHARDIMTRK